MKPVKPYPEFPLFAHATKRWAKKIRGKTHYFGPWDDPDGALEKYLSQKDALHSGRIARPDRNAVTVKDVANIFLAAKQEAVSHGDLSQRTWDYYKVASDLIVSTFGRSRLVSDLTPNDFMVLRRKMKWGPHRVANVIQYVRSIFNFAFALDLISIPVKFGPAFKGPSKKTVRLHRQAKGKNLFRAEEIRKLLSAASVQIKAMILLGINCGFGNTDCGRLPRLAVDLENGWVNYPRPKTAIERRCPLWPETVAAIKQVLTPDAKLVFVTKYGNSWATKDAITHEIAKLLHQLKINGRKGLGFYTLRHTFRTVADESKDQTAVNFIMGHADESMAAVYREGIEDERLTAVTNHVRQWLFSKPKSAVSADLERLP